MKLTKANRRSKNQFRNKHGMRVSGKSVFIIQRVLIEKGQK